ncbi:hypothetical protein CHS0354_023137 [Potamilus streckersoni]|uniref:Secreted protein n=1 Tax=Potamilus streckersoni TaxID=2493646 RepID=A0AAE0RNF2_9BIVA|nr:hypothetical protein CHS0354_023137 [Potamilus streckersoni]
MLRTFCCIVLIIPSLSVCIAYAQRCPSGCTCNTETNSGINQKLKGRRKYVHALMKRYIHKEDYDRQRCFVFLSYAGRDDELVNNYIYPGTGNIFETKV